jgi:hypothetical protein
MNGCGVLVAGGTRGAGLGSVKHDAKLAMPERSDALRILVGRGIGDALVHVIGVGVLVRMLVPDVVARMVVAMQDVGLRDHRRAPAPIDVIKPQ